MKHIRQELRRHRFHYLLLAFVLVFGFFLRVYRVDQVLGFYFDQGRDAIVIWDFLYKHKLFLIGPTTGIAGIFRGPFYYYLIAPAYFLGNGNPVFPAVFLALIAVFANYLLFKLAAEIQDKTTGIIACIIASCSFYIVLAGRWLSNPTPMLLLSMLLIYFMFRVSEGKRWYWVAISFTLGISLFHFGSSGEFFYFPAVFIFALWQRKHFPTPKIIAVSFFVFFLTFLPLLVFNFKHDNILLLNIKKFLIDDKSFKANFWDVAKQRLTFYYDVFTSKIFEGRYQRERVILGIVGIGFLVFLKSFWKNTKFKIVLLLFSSPLIGLLFFQGNEGNIYDYYLTGYYLVFILLFSLSLGKIWKYKLGKLFLIYFLYVFLTTNLNVLRYRLSDGLTGPETIAFGNQKQALDWVYADAQGQKFSVDVYVPPVIPYAYTYLFEWYGGRVHGYEPDVNQISPLYTVYEADPPHPERLKAWLDRQEKIATVTQEAQFGGITVQRRTRLE